MYILFACGAPHNTKGFEFATIEGSKNLPDGLIQYIDIYNIDKMKDGSTYVIQNISIGSRKYLVMVNYVSINPSDQKTSRGAYIAVGVVVDADVSLSSTVSYLCKIASSQGALSKLRDERNAFSRSFDIHKDIRDINLEYSDMAFLANLAYTHYSNDSSKKIVFNDIIHGNTTEIDNDIIVNQILQQEKLIGECQQKLEEEIIAHKYTRNDYDNEIIELRNKINELQEKLQNFQIPLEVDSKDELYFPNHRMDVNVNTNPVNTIPKTRKVPLYTDDSHRRRRSSGSNYGFTEETKKRSIMDIILLVLIICLVLLMGYFGYIWITDSSDTVYPPSNNISIQNKSIIQELDKDSDIKVSEEDNLIVAKDTEDKKLDKNVDKPIKIQENSNEVEKQLEMPKKSIGTLEKLKELNKEQHN